MSRTVYRRGHCPAHGEHILTVDDRMRDAIRTGALGDVRDGGCALDGSAHAVAVVLDDDRPPAAATDQPC